MAARASEYPRTNRASPSRATDNRPDRAPASTTARYRGGIASCSASSASGKLSPRLKRRPSAVVIRRRPPGSSVPAPSRPRSSGTPARTSAVISSFRADSSSIEIRPAPPCLNAPSAIVSTPGPAWRSLTPARAYDICDSPISPHLSEAVKTGVKNKFRAAPRLEERRRSQQGGCLPRLLHWPHENMRLYVHYYLHGKSLATSLKCKRRALNDMHFLCNKPEAQAKGIE